jgi:tripartite ATP-independent transporter DctM subunit
MLLVVFSLAFVLLLGIGVPISMGLGGAAMAYVFWYGDLSPTMLVQNTFGGMTAYPLLAIPLFILSGNLMSEGGLSKDLVNFTRLLVGHVSGGLGLATILASAIFAAISGAAVATAVAIGMVMIPAMKEAGYEPEVAAGLTATASCMGPIIPPSIPFIMYAVMANVSISELFLAGVVPGLLLGTGLMIYMSYIARKRNYPREQRATFRQVVVGTWTAIPALLMPFIIMGGILGGVFTPTEAAGVVVLYAFLAGMFIKKQLTLTSIPRVLLRTGLESAMVMLLLGLSEPFSWVIAAEQVPKFFIEGITSISTSPAVVLLLVNIILIIVGIPLETAPAITIVTPVLAPIAIKLGIDPLHLGVVVCFNLVLGLITPPVGAVLFVTCGISGLKIEQLSRGIWPPFFVAIAVLLLITYFPPLSTFLPQLLR